MSGFLLDTNCISEDTRPHPNPGVVAWLKQANLSSLYLSVLTLGEIRKGIEGLPHGRRRTDLTTWLETSLRQQFGRRLLGIDTPIAECWGALEAQAKRQGRGLGVIDALLAATAIEYNLTLVTRNTRDFAAVQVSVFNPWT